MHVFVHIYMCVHTDFWWAFLASGLALIFWGRFDPQCTKYFSRGEKSDQNPQVLSRLLPRHKIFCPQWPVLGFFLVSGLALIFGERFDFGSFFRSEVYPQCTKYFSRGEKSDQNPKF